MLIPVLLLSLFILQVRSSCKNPYVEQRLLADHVRYTSPFHVIALPNTTKTQEMDNVCYTFFDNPDGGFFHIISIKYKNGTNTFDLYLKADIFNRIGISEGKATTDQCVYQDYTLKPICNVNVFILYRCFIEGECNVNIDIGPTPGVDVRIALAADTRISAECEAEVQSSLRDISTLDGGDYILLPQKLSPNCITKYNDMVSIGEHRAFGKKTVTDIIYPLGRTPGTDERTVCGVFRKNLTVSASIVDGQQAYLGFFPWHAGLYYREDKNEATFWDQKCGGSLITEQFILTASHCVKDVVHDVGRLRIALGKYNRSWDVIDPGEQRRNVSAISIPIEFRPSTLHFDIALVLLSKRIRFGEYIMPVCLDMIPTQSFVYFQGRKFYVAGWGKTTSDGTSSDTLLFNTVTLLSDNDCTKSVPDYFNTYEKLCGVGNISESIVQRGDSGGGLTATYRNGLHYIIGIVSNKVKNVSVFTRINYKTHIEWIESEMIQLKRQYDRDYRLNYF